MTGFQFNATVLNLENLWAAIGSRSSGNPINVTPDDDTLREQAQATRDALIAAYKELQEKYSKLLNAERPKVKVKRSKKYKRGQVETIQLLLRGSMKDGPLNHKATAERLLGLVNDARWACHRGEEDTMTKADQVEKILRKEITLAEDNKVALDAVRAKDEIQ